MSKLGGNSPSADTDKSNNLTGNNGAPGADGVVQAVVGGTNCSVDATDPANPIINVAASSSPTTTKGDVIARGTSADERVAVGTDGQHLVADAASSAGVKWETPSGGSDPDFNPPLAAIFPTTVKAGATTFTDDSDRGLRLADTSTVADDILARVKPVPSGDWTATAKLVVNMHAKNFNSMGLVLREASSDKSTCFRYLANNEFAVGVTRYTADAFDSHLLLSEEITPSATWMRIVRTSGGFSFQLSSDGQIFYEVTSQALTAHGTPDQLGIFINPQQTAGNSLTIEYWDDPDDPA